MGILIQIFILNLTVILISSIKYGFESWILEKPAPKNVLFAAQYQSINDPFWGLTLEIIFVEKL